MALYTDAAGPSTLIAATASTLIAAGDNQFPVLTPVRVPAGTYWVAAQFSDSASICYDSKSSNTVEYVQYNAYTHGNLPMSFGASNRPIVTVSNTVDFDYYVIGTL